MKEIVQGWFWLENIDEEGMENFLNCLMIFILYILKSSLFNMIDYI